ncbi:PucR family transcriptional regulator [Streptomyces sp. L2]|uniref:PucR family transcriptional regulator n=1 Tax=Streptomyces sp. L2 TaxID=2162665 RepID=UPI0013E95884|nr:PucR family transcriptional regulator [Streptomyces sp. L2]
MRRPEGRGLGGPDETLARHWLVRALTKSPGPPEETLAELAHSANWRLPDTVQIVALTPAPGRHRGVLQQSDVLADWHAETPFLLIPDPAPDSLTLVRRALRGTTAAIAPVVPRPYAAASLRWSRTMLALVPEHRGAQTRMVRVEEHLATVLLLQDEALLRLFTGRLLHPLADLTQRQNERATETLLAWLENGNGARAAEALGVHPQTVRYRLRRLGKLFGPLLRDPQRRFELELALRASRLADELRRKHLRVPARRRPDTPEVWSRQC